jgi:hypothetical protein
MGLMRFLVPPPEQITTEMLQCAYLSGMDRTPWPVRTRAEGVELVVERDSSESGNLTVPWQVEGHGLLALSTASLIKRPEPYLLPLELARGTITLLRNQLADWQALGLVVPEETRLRLPEAVEQFGRSAVNQGDPAAAAAQAQTALRTALDASRLLARAYCEQALAVRKRGGAKLNALLGAELAGPALDDAAGRDFLVAFNAALVRLSWRDIEASEGQFDWLACDRQIEWCRARGLRVMAGPLVELDARSLPDWVHLWEDDLDNLLAALSDFVRAAVDRYRGKVDLWLCAARVNTAEVLKLTEEEELQLAANILHFVNSLDPGKPTVLSVDQPWGEYMARRPTDFPPQHFAETLARAGLNLRGLMLEMNLGYCRGATLPRTELELNRQIDSWSQLGLPLLVSLSIPSSSGEDPLAQRPATMPSQSATPSSQQDWAARYASLLLAKASVQGVFWNQLGDSMPHDFPHAGLFDARRQAKPALRTLASIRLAHLK